MAVIVEVAIDHIELTFYVVEKFWNGDHVLESCKLRWIKL